MLYVTQLVGQVEIHIQICLIPDSEGVAPLERDKPHLAGQSTLLEECSLGLASLWEGSVWHGLPHGGLFGSRRALEQVCQSRALGELGHTLLW